MKKNLTKYYFLFIAMFIGYFMTVQLSANISPVRGIITIPKILEMKNDLDNINRENQMLAEAINQADLTLKNYEQNLNKNGDVIANMENEMKAARSYAGYEEERGPGIIITMNDSTAAVPQGGNPDWYVIHDSDILGIINELRAAGAEAISINEERVTATSNIRCGGPTINIDNKRHAVPFIIKAIGDPQKLEASVTAPLSSIDYMEFYGIQINIQKAEKLIINAYDMKYKLNYQKKVEDGE